MTAKERQDADDWLAAQRAKALKDSNH